MTFTCPICHRQLNRVNNSYICESNHCFDIAKQGYVNLIQNGGNHGDDKQMVEARKEFLSMGYYEPLAKALSEILIEHTENNIAVLDAGCGEGYYMSYISKALCDAGITFEYFGIDVSKEAAIKASKSNKNINVAVASVYDLPFADASFDIVFSVFAPSAKEEFIRVTKDLGYLIVVYPGKDHLIGLKEVLYDHPYENSPSDSQIDGFSLISENEVSYDIHLPKDDAVKLFKMTPYFYNTPKKGYENLQNSEYVNTKVQFIISLFQKHNN